MAAPIDQLDRTPIVIRQASGRIVGLLIVSLAFVAIGLLIPDMEQSSVGRDATAHHIWSLTVALFGLCSGVFVWQLAKPGQLELTAEGVVQTVLGRTHLVRWREAENFRVWKYRSTTLIAYDDLRDPSIRSGVDKALSAVLNKAFGVGAALPVGWTMKPQAVADLLNAARARWA
jgi:hypothetical protein